MASRPRNGVFADWIVGLRSGGIELLFQDAAACAEVDDRQHDDRQQRRPTSIRLFSMVGEILRFREVHPPPLPGRECLWGVTGGGGRRPDPRLMSGKLPACRDFQRSMIDTADGWQRAAEKS